MAKTESQGPAVSVVIPCKNDGALLVDAVESVLDQDTSHCIEVIVVDDDASSETRRAQKAFRTNTSVRILDNNRSPGPAGARNTGIRQARGDWIAFLDADDILLPGSLDLRLNVAQTQKDAKFIAGDFIEADMQGNRRRWIPRFEHLERVRPEIQRIENAAASIPSAITFRRPVDLLANAQIVSTCTVMAERRLLRSLGGFDENLETGEDTNLWMRLAHATDLYFLPDPLAVYQRRQGSLSNRDKPTQVTSRRGIHVLLEDPEFQPYRTALRNRLTRMNRRLAYHYRERGRYAEAVDAALRAVKHSPTDWSAWRCFLGAVIGRE